MPLTRSPFTRTFATATITLCAATGCSDKNSSYPVASAGQGGAIVREEPNPPRPVREAAAPAGPTAREVDQQRKIAALEAESRALQDHSKELQAEIDRLKREQK